MTDPRQFDGIRPGPPASADDETLLEFPVDFPIKVIGRESATFESAIVGILEEHFERVDRDGITSRPSRGGRYTAITATVRAQSKAQLDAAYQALTAHVEVLWAL